MTATTIASMVPITATTPGARPAAGPGGNSSVRIARGPGSDPVRRKAPTANAPSPATTAGRAQRLSRSRSARGHERAATATAITASSAAAGLHHTASATMTIASGRVRWCAHAASAASTGSIVSAPSAGARASGAGAARARVAIPAVAPSSADAEASRQPRREGDEQHGAQRRQHADGEHGPARRHVAQHGERSAERVQRAPSAGRGRVDERRPAVRDVRDLEDQPEDPGARQRGLDAEHGGRPQDGGEEKRETTKRQHACRPPYATGHACIAPGAEAAGRTRTKLRWWPRSPRTRSTATMQRAPPSEVEPFVAPDTSPARC